MVDHAHAFWPLYSHFLEGSTDNHFKSMGFGISTTFTSLYILNGPSKNDTYLLKVLLAASNKAITGFLKIVNNLHLLVQMTESTRLQKELGERRWEKCIHFVHVTYHSMSYVIFNFLNETNFVLNCRTSHDRMFLNYLYFSCFNAIALLCQMFIKKVIFDAHPNPLD